MIDLHHHLLYDVDDGAADLECSLAMAFEAANEGVTHIVCTPHANERYPFRAELFGERFRVLQQELAGQMTLSLGCEMHITAENVDAAVANPFLYSINGKGYLLVEFDELVIPPVVDDELDRLLAAGYRLIIAHPERYPAVLSDPERLARWMRMGCLTQVTASALTGRFGKAAQTLSNQMLQRDWIHFLATDAHNLSSRPPNLKAGYDYVAEHKGEETAQRLCVSNPQAVVDGASWPEQPEAVGLWEQIPLSVSSKRFSSPLKKSAEVGKSSARTGFFKRLFGR